MKYEWNGGYSTVFGAAIDIEIADALKHGMTIESVYAELSARTRELAEQMVKNHLAAQRALREASECEA